MLLNENKLTVKKWWIAVVTMLAVGCAHESTVSQLTGKDTAQAVIKPLDGLSAEASYRLGLMQLDLLRKSKLNQQSFEQGLRDALDGKPIDEPGNSLDSQNDWQTLANLNFEAMKIANLTAGKKFLEENKSQPDVMTLDNGVQYKILKPSKSSQMPNLDDIVGIVYKITSIDGKVKGNYSASKT